MFVGSPRANQKIQIDDHDVSDFNTPSATASISFTSAGDLTLTGSGADVPAAYEWAKRQFSGLGAGYEIKLDVISGTSPTSGPTTATWHALSTTRTWALTYSGSPGSLTGVWRATIRNATTLVTMDTADYTMYAEVVA